MRITTFLAGSLFVIGTVLPTGWLIAQPVASRNLSQAPQLMTSENGVNLGAMSLAKAEIHTVINGYLAETTMTMTFRNDATRVLEGELSFPLPESATVSGYALDVNGTLVDGVPVERQKARITYEKELRKKVDPGLVEQAVGNNFKTRIYPIPAQGTRTVRVQYVSNVTESGDRATYLLPMNWGQIVGECTVSIEIIKPIGEPTMRGWKLNQLGFEHHGDRYSLTHTFTREKLDSDLVISLPAMARGSVYVEKRVKETHSVESLLDPKKDLQAGKEEYFFTISDKPDAVVIDHLAKKPTHIGILWDASLSRATTDKSREIATLRKVLENLDPGAEVDIVPFRNEPDAPKVFKTRDVAGIVDYLNEIVYDGGTNLGAITAVSNLSFLAGAPASRGPVSNYDYWLLFSDGIADLGKEMPVALETPIYVVSNDSKANYALLKRIAAVSGGNYANLLRLNDDEAARTIGLSSYSLMGVDSKPGEVAEIFPAGNQPAAGRVMVSGRLLVPQATVTLKYGLNGKVMERHEVTLKQADATDTGLVPRFWAQQKVADLSADVEQNADALISLGKEFNIVTPNSSLMVLETVQQYLEHRIVPPKSRASVYAQFMNSIEQQKQQQSQTRDERIASVLILWNQRVKWWEGTYSYAANFKYREEPNKDDHAGDSHFVGNSPAAAPAGGITITPRPIQPVPPVPPGTPPIETRRLQVADLVKSDSEFEHATDRSVASANRLGSFAGSGSGGGSSGGGGGGLFGSSGSSSNERPMAQDSRSRVSDLKSIAAPTDFDNPPDLSLAATGTTGMASAAKKESKDVNASVSVGSKDIQIKAWDPAVPYLVAMRESGGEGAYAVYLKQRAAFMASPAFYFDCADYLLRNGQKRLGIRVLTSVAELKLEDAQLLRIVAHKLNQVGDPMNRDLAIDLFRKVAKLRPEEPQSYRDLALALADRADAAGLEPSAGVQAAPQRAADYIQAIDLLSKVILTKWDRFEEIEVIALMEANRIIAKLNGLPGAHDTYTSLDPRLIQNLDCDVRIALTWDADATDVDLWVTEPSGEKCFYSHNRTTIGGMMSKDFTQGYGPEEYCLRKAMAGEYKIQANYYGSSQQSLVGPCTVQATVITDFGRPTEKRQYLTLRLTQTKDVVDVGAITLGKK